MKPEKFANIEEIHYKILLNFNIFRSFYHKKFFNVAMLLNTLF